MYCRYCGKPIDQDSVFCEHCGKLQTSETNVDVKVQTQTKEVDSKSKIASKAINSIVCCFLYFLWFWLNLKLLERNDYSSGYRYEFYPFTRDYFEVNSYGMPEFLVYTIVIPLILFLMVKYRKQIYQNYQKKRTRNKS